VSNSHSQKAEKEQTLQPTFEVANQMLQNTQAELQQLRRSQALAEQEAARQQQRAEEALNSFKVAQSRFRQVEKERDQQILVAAEARQELAQLQTRLEQDRQLLLQKLARFEQDLRALQVSRTVRAATKVSKLASGLLRLVRGAISIVNVLAPK
jgi:proline dehydrogenase